jgi:hypothetical protein
MFIISFPPKNDFYVIILFFFLFDKMHDYGTYTISCFSLVYIYNLRNSTLINKVSRIFLNLMYYPSPPNIFKTPFQIKIISLFWPCHRK